MTALHSGRFNSPHMRSTTPLPPSSFVTTNYILLRTTDHPLYRACIRKTLLSWLAAVQRSAHMNRATHLKSDLQSVLGRLQYHLSVARTMLTSASSYDRDTIIAVSVGQDEHRFAVHKDVVCAKSQFFHAACSARWSKGGERVVRLPDVEPREFQMYVDWSYTSKLVVEDDESISDRGMGLARIYLLGDVLDDVKLRNEAARLLSAVVIKHGDLPPRLVRLIWENTPTSSLLRKWIVDTTVLLMDRAYFAQIAAHYPAEFMLEIATNAMRRLPQIARQQRETECRCLLVNYLESEGETPK